MRDPLEGLTAAGLIRTGADRARIPQRFLTLLDVAVDRIRATAPEATVYLYGSVATGTARPPESDVDLLTIGLYADIAAAIGRELSIEFTDVCRGVDIAAGTPEDFHGDSDEAYGGRVFLHHYCVHLAGSDLDRATAGFPGDRRAARGFNGDIAVHAARWRRDLGGSDTTVLARRVARKTLLSVAGLVSIHDATWTTDREHAARRWQQIHPELAHGLDELVAWSSPPATADPARVAARLDTTVDQIVHQFAHDIGLWST